MQMPLQRQRMPREGNKAVISIIPARPRGFDGGRWFV